MTDSSDMLRLKKKLHTAEDALKIILALSDRLGDDSTSVYQAAVNGVANTALNSIARHGDN